jgi:2-oxo-4-hydroxy-4-carboxy--5-ureidoimidazoline (OHCU) decarboxylase
VPRANGAHAADSQSWERRTKEVLLAASDNLDLTEILNEALQGEDCAAEKCEESVRAQQATDLQEIRVWVKVDNAPKPTKVSLLTNTQDLRTTSAIQSRMSGHSKAPTDSRP